MLVPRIKNNYGGALVVISFLFLISAEALAFGQLV